MTRLERLDAARIEDAGRRIAPHIRHTPLVPRAGGGWIKLELLQPTGSFKVRGFFAAALALDPGRAARGLMTVSAGNAALACAFVAHELRVPCRVVMADTAPALKLDGVRALGATPVLLPRERLLEWVATRAWESDPEVFIHPFADDAVITGHATIVPEILADCPDVDRVLVAAGGGGLITAIAWGFAALKPGVRVVGVQSDGYPLWSHAFAAGGAVSLTPRTIADGTTAPFDPLMYERLRASIHEWIRGSRSRGAASGLPAGEGGEGGRRRSRCARLRGDGVGATECAHRGDPQRRQPRRLAARRAADRVTGATSRRRWRPATRRSRIEDAPRER